MSGSLFLIDRWIDSLGKQLSHTQMLLCRFIHRLFAMRRENPRSTGICLGRRKRITNILCHSPEPSLTTLVTLPRFRSRFQIGLTLRTPERTNTQTTQTNTRSGRFIDSFDSFIHSSTTATTLLPASL
mmetsp:Transcript_14301/g.32102  ORF Transcript_14301/g.32102 Transcript_14301/m.32102 type:complete len:128 (+) Transcript_14301:813-1196(+)